MSARKFRKKARSYRHTYSYSPSSSLRDEEVAAYRRLALAVALVILFSGGLYLWGVDAVAVLGSFWSQFFPQTQNLQPGNLTSTSETTLLAPNLDPLPLQTNNPQEIQIRGWAQSGYEVRVYLNDKPIGQLLAGKDGRFSLDTQNLPLVEGKNKFYATTLKGSRESKPSQIQEVIYDKTPPKLEVTLSEVNPKEVSVEISGSSEPRATVTINGHRAIVTLQGTFTYTLTNLQNGENRVKVVARDEAGNETVIEKSVIYDPSSKPSPEASPQPT